MFWQRRSSAEEYEVDEIAHSWVRACEGAGLVREVSTVTGPTVIPPTVTHVVLGPPRVLTVRLQPGQTVADVRALAPRIAPHMGAYGLRVEPRGSGEWAVITLLTSDPLAETVPMTYGLGGRTLLGRLDDGADLVQDMRQEAHTIVQGVTRSGKSVFTYSLLAQLCRDPDVLISGCDPTGLLWRPFAGSRHAGWQVSGLASLDAHESVLVRLVDKMDQRIIDLPADRDTMPVSPAVPLVLVVLEELAGLYRAADAASKDQGKRLRALIGRLLAEGAKAGFRVLLLVQRAEAAIVGGFDRANCSTRISFRTDNRAGVELLHPGTDPVIADQHTTAAPGIALVSTPGRPLSRMRAPWFGDYSAYVRAVKVAA
jgi:S-DNA-T family DNA segregation ATPase FtsK/SpoIIIE